METTIIRAAEHHSVDVVKLFEDNNLPIADLLEAKPLFGIAIQNGRIVGSVGIEQFGHYGILRSLAVADTHKGQGLGKMLVQWAYDESVALGITSLYLLTQTAAQFFGKMNWRVVDRNTVPTGIAQSTEFANICPSTATCMALSLKPRMASQLFAQGFNCAQSVWVPFAIEQGMDQNQALKLATGFGAGIAQRGETCGAVTGAIMALGLNYGRCEADDVASRDRTYEAIHRLTDRFCAVHGSVNCRDLLGADLSTDEGRKLAHEQNRFERCPRFIDEASTFVESVN